MRLDILSTVEFLYFSRLRMPGACHMPLISSRASSRPPFAGLSKNITTILKHVRKAGCGSVAPGRGLKLSPTV